MAYTKHVKRQEVMNMITFQGKEVHLRHKRLNVNDTLPSFTIVKNDLSEIKSDDTKGIRVFLSVTSLDTGVCSMEVAKFMQYFQGDQKLTCYAISMDLPFALDRWCQAKENDNIITTSDYKYQSFGQLTGTIIDELNLLTRAVFVVDENNILQYVEYVSEITNEPDYDAVLNKIAQLTR